MTVCAPALPAPVLSSQGASVRALLADPLVDDVASAQLFAALGEVPLRVSEAVWSGSLAPGQAVELAGQALRLQGLLRNQARQSQSDAFACVQEVIAEGVAAQRERLRLAYSADGDVAETADPTVVRFARNVGPMITWVEPRREDVLTTREQQVLGLIATGATNQQIAHRLVVSESTAKWHVKRILRKLGAANRAEAAYLHLRSAGGQAHAG